MHRIIAISTAIALGVTAPAQAYNVAPSLGIDAAVSMLTTSLGTSFATSPTCVTRVLMAQDTTPARTESITCLDVMCTTREIVFCAYSD